MSVYQSGQTKAEEKPAAGIQRQKGEILIGHKHRKNSDHSQQQGRGKMHESKNIRIFHQISQGIREGGDHGKDIKTSDNK